MPQYSAFNILLRLPLFQGMSQSDLSTAIGQTRFGFTKALAGKTIVTADEPCNHLLFLLSGSMRVTTQSANRIYWMEEEIMAPAVIQPEHLFGWTQRYTHTFTAIEDCQLLSLEKSEVLKLADAFLIFRLNQLNMLSTLSQKLTRQLWQPQPETLAGRIVRFVERRCLRPAGPKTLHIKMKDLARELHANRLHVSLALNNLQDAGLIALRRATIHIPHVEDLLKSPL